MPAYGTLPDRIVGPIADLAREAADCEQNGDVSTAIFLYQQALEQSLRERPELPGFVCGRLAALLRRAKRYRDEVELLERYRASQSDDSARIRLDARLSKARTLEERHRQQDCGALASVRRIKKSKPRRGTAERPADPSHAGVVGS